MNINEWIRRHNISTEAMLEFYQITGAPISKTQGAVLSENRIQREIRLATNDTGGLLFRNNSGVARETRADGTARPVRYGLGNDSPKLNKVLKSSDLIGITPVTVLSKHVGRVHGIFTAMEVKNSTWSYHAGDRECAQLAFLQAIRLRGGIAAFAASPLDYFNAITEFRQ